MPSLAQNTPYYGGVQLQYPVQGLSGPSAPPTNLPTFAPIGQTTWTNTTTQTVYMLTAKSPATWAVLGGGAADVNTLTPDSGTSPVVPVGGTITLAGGTGLTTVGGTNTMTFNVTGGGIKYTTVTADTTMVVNAGYITNKAGTAAAMTLPATAAVGSKLSVIGRGATGWSIAQAAGQTIHMNSVSTTTGAGGSLASTAQFNTVEMICTIADTDWTVVGSEGVLTVT